MKSRRNVQQFETSKRKHDFSSVNPYVPLELFHSSAGVLRLLCLSQLCFFEFASMKPQLFCDIQYSVESIHVACLLRHSAV